MYTSVCFHSLIYISDKLWGEMSLPPVAVCLRAGGHGPQRVSTCIAYEMFHLLIPAKISLLHSSNLAAVNQ